VEPEEEPLEALDPDEAEEPELDPPVVVVLLVPLVVEVMRVEVWVEVEVVEAAEMEEVVPAP